MTDFEAWWVSYPRKVAKKAAEAAYMRLVRSVAPEAIQAALRAYIDIEWRQRLRQKRLQYIPHAATWLNATDFTAFEERTETLFDEVDDLDRDLAEERERLLAELRSLQK